MGTVRRTFVARRAYSVVAVIQMVLDGKLPNTGFLKQEDIPQMVLDGQLPNTGFLKQEDIPLAAFLETEMGSF